MKVYELLTFGGEFLRRCVAAGINPGDCKYVDLYAEYRGLLAAGEKVTYAVACLADKYGVSERQVFYLVKRLGGDVDCSACSDG